MIASTTRGDFLRKTMFVATWITTSLFACLATASLACAPMTFDQARFTICTADPATETVRLWLNTADGNRIGTFSRLADTVADGGEALVFAMNAGMYHPDRRPVGLYIEDGFEQTRIVTREGPGNFGLLPNGVLCLTDTSALVMESRAFANDPPDCRYATQSGPMLVIDGRLHPRFIPGGTSLNIRNGVGVGANGLLYFAISDDPVNFDTIGRLFRDALGTPNALFLDGRISRLHAPGLGRSDFGLPLGPMIGVTRPAD